MSKTELRVIARIILIGVGLYVLLQTLMTFLGNIAIMPFIEPSSKTQITVFIAAITIYILITAAAVYVLFRCENSFSAKIVEYGPIDDSQISWLAAAFRIVCVIAGVLFFYWTTPNLIVTVVRYIMNINNEPGQRQIYIGMSSKIDIAKYALLLGLGIYLVYGAPGFVRWQVKKTIKQCNKIIEQQKAWG